MDVEVRPLAEGDVEAAMRVQSASFDDYDRRRGDDPAAPAPDADARQRRRYEHFRTHDPGGAWVAVTDGRIVGVTLASLRDGLWGLSLLAVDPAAQSAGVGRRLLDAALTYAAGGSTAVILSSQDPRAIHRYAAAGFALHPQVHAHGHVDAARLPVAGRRAVRESRTDDADLLAAIDIGVRASRRGVDHELLASFYGPRFVVDDIDGRGYAYTGPRGGTYTLAATDDATAEALLWRCLAHDVDCGRASDIDHVNGGQQWAVRVAVAARLSFVAAGPVFWRGRQPPAGYIPCGAYL